MGVVIWLDNLKLGYGGTKQEMERLLADAEKLSGQKFDLSSYADIVEAIHVVQTEMGITGTTAKEAATTIQGSVASMKSAWQNLLTGMADENQNLDVLFGQFVDSVVTVGNNVIPRIQKLLPRIVEGVSALANQLAAHLPEIVESLLPSLLTGAISLVAALIQNIPSLVLSIVKAFVQALQSLFQTVKESGAEMLGNLVSGIAENIPELLKQAAAIIAELVKGIVGNLPKIISAAGKIIASLVKGLAKGVSELFGVGKNLLNGLWKGFKSVWSSISGWVSEKVGWIADKFKAVKDFFSGIKDAATGAASTKTATKTANVKKHASGAILKKPTIFGYTPSSGTYHLGGEAGAEAVAPIDKLMGYVRTAVAEQNNDSLLVEIRSLLERLLQAVQLGQGDTVIPVYIGTEKIDEIIMTAKQRMTNRSGGFANV